MFPQVVGGTWVHTVPVGLIAQQFRARRLRSRCGGLTPVGAAERRPYCERCEEAYSAQ